MTPAEIAARKEAIVAQHGAWTAHNIRLADGLFTIGPKATGLEVLTQRFLQNTQDFLAKPLDQLRVLDLASLEGMFAIEFAMHGAQTLGIEARETHVEKARFAAEALGLAQCRFELGDVRSLNPGRHGMFDVVICCGIFYHLDAPDIFKFMESISAVCNGLLLIDTHIAPQAQEKRQYGQQTYWGARFNEHKPEATAEEKQQALWASIDNPESFWLTRASLINLCHDCGFTSVHETCMPMAYHTADRLTFTAVKGKTAQLRCAAPGPVLASLRMPEDHEWDPPRAPRPGLLEAHKHSLRHKIGRWLCR